MVFCNDNEYGLYEPISQVTILILVDGFLQLSNKKKEEIYSSKVTILILVDGFLQ